MPQKKRSGVTLIEMLIVVVLLIILAIGAVMLLDPKKQIAKATDIRKKTDLEAFKKALEDYYNDKGCYPPPSKVCYTGGDNPADLSAAIQCFVCGTVQSSPSLAPYLEKLICDPDHPKKRYMYTIDNISNLSCPKWYKIYTNLDTVADPDSIAAGCGEGGCGFAPNYGYDYGVSSPNVNLETTPFFYCLTRSFTCDNCNTFAECRTEPSCTTIYATQRLCCDIVPKPRGCL